MTNVRRIDREQWESDTRGTSQPVVSNSGVSPVVDAGVAESWVLTLNAATVTIGAVNARAIGDKVYIVAVQDLTGGRNIAWASNFRNAPTGSGSASQRLSCEFRWDGVSWQMTGGSTAFA